MSGETTAQEVLERLRKHQRQAIDFGVFVQLLARNRGHIGDALQDARSGGNLMARAYLALNGMSSGHTLSTLITRAAVSPGSSSDATWAGPLAPLVPLANEFVSYMRPKTVLGSLNYRPVPFNCSYSRATAGTSAGWIAQNSPRPIAKLSFDTQSLPYAKFGGVTVITNELAQFSSPIAASIITADLADELAFFEDRAFLDPDQAAVAEQNPASITFGAQQYQSSGITFNDFVADFKLLMRYITDQKLRLSECTWVMGEETAAYLATLTNTNSDFCFDDLGPAGGTLFKLPVLTSGTLPQTASPSETFIALMHGPSIAVADSNIADISVTTDAAVQQSDAPAGGAQVLKSLWQHGLIGIKSTRWCNWKRRRDAAVVVLRGINI